MNNAHAHTRLRIVSPEGVPECFSVIRLARLRLVLEAKEYLPLDGFIGPSLRGMLGHALTLADEMSGVDPALGLFHTVFENPPVPPGRRDRPAPPYLVHPPAEFYSGLEPGRLLSFDLTLVGDAAERAIAVLWAIHQYGLTEGLTRDRRKFGLVAASADTPIGTVPLMGVGVTHVPRGWNNQWTWRGDQLIEAERTALHGPTHHLELSLRTPLELRERRPDGVRQVVRDIQFSHLFYALYWAADGYCRVGGGEGLSLDYTQLRDKAATLVKVEDHTEEVPLIRHSHRRELSHPRGPVMATASGIGDEVPLAGRVGTLLFQGDVSPFIDLLTLGRILNVGRCRPAGLGALNFELG